jgi:hypothetical protein
LTETVFFVAMGNKWLFGKKRNVSQKMLNWSTIVWSIYVNNKNIATIRTRCGDDNANDMQLLTPSV